MMNSLRLLALFPVLFSVGEGNNCPTGFTESTDGVSCLNFFSGTKTWLKAEEHCQTLGGHLVTVGTAERNEEVIY